MYVRANDRDLTCVRVCVNENEFESEDQSALIDHVMHWMRTARNGTAKCLDGSKMQDNLEY